RKVVVLIRQRVREILEVLSAGRCLRARCRRRRAARRTFAVEITAATGGSTSATAEHDHFTNVDLGAVARLAVLVLPLAILDPSFDVELVAFLHVALDDVGELRALRVP